MIKSYFLYNVHFFKKIENECMHILRLSWVDDPRSASGR